MTSRIESYVRYDVSWNQTVSVIILKKPKGNDGTHRCELNDVTHAGNSNDLVEDQRYIYRGVEASAT